MKALTQRITDIIEPSLQADGFELVQVSIMEGKKQRTVQIMAENAQTGRITLDECAKVSRTISALLDVEDAIDSAYTLEVSSPGVDRPLTKHADFERYLGFDAKIETALPIDGRRRFKGPLKAVDAERVTIQVDAEEFALPLSNIQQAKLVLTDALLKAHQDGAFQSQQPKEEVN
ncbi:MAG: ribosome maturation factor RimP [Rickettsiales bacterium]|nr:ribosome maturation factor RimP [Rickettsiales bacterium]